MLKIYIDININWIKNIKYNLWSYNMDYRFPTIDLEKLLDFLNKVLILINKKYNICIIDNLYLIQSDILNNLI